MRSPISTFGSLLAILLALTSFASAERLIESNSLQNCGAANETGFTAKLLNVRYTPDNGTLALRLSGISTISGKIILSLDVSAYGYKAISLNLNPCDHKEELAGFCPVPAAPIDLPQNNVKVPSSAANAIPGIAFTMPDLQASVQVKIFGNDDNADRGKQLACVQANLSNGKSVYQKAVGWATAVIAGLGLLVSAIVSGLGHSNTAAHVAANAMSLFGFFQTQAMFGMTAVPLPPIVAAWTQNFQWSLGIINSDTVESISTWYQRATGGTPSQLLNKLQNTSVNVQKRSLDAVNQYAPYVPRAVAYMSTPHMREYFGTTIMSRAYHPVVKRAVEPIASAFSQIMKRDEIGQTVTVSGISRVGFRANIEETNIFLTGYIFFIFFVILVVIGVVAFKWILEGLSRAGKMKSDKFQDFRNGWTTVLKGILYRLILIGFPQMVVLCFWEMTRRDSAGEVALAVITLVVMIVMLVFVCAKVVLIARRSITMHKNPAYILYSDPLCLHKWGFLYVQFKAATYWFIIPQLGYTLIFGMFVAFGQGSGIAQAIGLLIINLGWLVALSIIRPYMDKKTNGFNISIASINFVSSIFILFFTNVFGLPGLVNGVMGILFFLVNVVFALVLLIMLLVSSGFAIFSKNPDVRYQPMRDDRGSFIKSQTNLTNELDALGATARGETKTPFAREADADSYSSGSLENNKGYAHVEGGPTHSMTSYDSSPFAHQDRNSVHSDMSRYRAQNNASPWQRGAGYDR